MINRFYNEYDWSCLEPRGEDSYRTPFAVDRDRIIYTGAFRRLQAKTQVFLSGEHDFYRTRLTHSIEVAQIGRSICRYLQQVERQLDADCFIDPDLVEAVCLAHDLGHPPFGHAGERCLHEYMKNKGGFEGNAQSLRLVTKQFYQAANGPRGMAATRAFLDGIMKYKTLYRDVPGARHHFLYDDQQPLLAFVHEGLEDPYSFQGTSIECQIMDWADDTAYCLNDLLDGAEAGFLTLENLLRWRDRQPSLDVDTLQWWESLETGLRKGRLEAMLGRRVGDFLKACHLESAESPLAGKSKRHAYRLRVEENILREAAFYKKLALEIIFLSPPLQQMEFKASHVLIQLFDACVAQVENISSRRILHILPPGLETALQRETGALERMRLLCDFLASLTDGQALRMHRRLFDPSYTNLAELPYQSAVLGPFS